MEGGKSDTPRSFPLASGPRALPGADQYYKSVFPAFCDALNEGGIPRPTSRIPKGDMDSYVRGLEKVVMSLFSQCWVANPRIDPNNKGNVIVDGSYIIPNIFRNDSFVASVVDCAAKFYQHYGARVEITGYVERKFMDKGKGRGEDRG